jgi:hypothetical protein
LRRPITVTFHPARRWKHDLHGADRPPSVRPLVGLDAAKAGRRHADDRERHAAEYDDGLTDDGGIAAEAALPEVVAQYDRSLGVGQRVVHGHEAAADRHPTPRTWQAPIDRAQLEQFTLATDDSASVTNIASKMLHLADWLPS